jgi:hypothetical protein
MKVTALVGTIVAFLTFASVSTAAAVGDGWRWPRYDSKAVKIHVVVDTSVPKSMVPLIRDGAHYWEATGDIRFDYPPKPVSCEPIMPNTICVSATDTLSGQFTGQPWTSFGGWAWQAIPPAIPVLQVGADGLNLMVYGRVWINTLQILPGDDDWVRHVFCHEIGHDIGLGHPDDTQAPGTYEASCMSNNFGPAPDYPYYSMRPSADDLAFIHTLYLIRDQAPAAPPPKPPPAPKPHGPVTP